MIIVWINIGIRSVLLMCAIVSKDGRAVLRDKKRIGQRSKCYYAIASNQKMTQMILKSAFQSIIDLIYDYKV